MGFYTSPSFFIVQRLQSMTACGVMERGLKAWGMVASAVMLAFLFGSSPAQAASFALFVCVACTCAYATLASWKSGKKSMVVYRVCLAATIAPLVAYKVGAVFDQNILAFAGISRVTFKAVQGAYRDSRWPYHGAASGGLPARLLRFSPPSPPGPSIARGGLWTISGASQRVPNTWTCCRAACSCCCWARFFSW